MMSSQFDRPSAILILWIHRSLEFLWLAIVILVPLTFMTGSDGFPPPKIFYIPVAKVGPFRILTGAMGILWLIEWGLRDRLPLGSLFKIQGSYGALSRKKISIFISWLKEHPVRWVLSAVVLFLVSVLLSTALSVSIGMSFWGDVPGHEGYSTYTVVCHLLLFGVIATHLRTKTQLWRLVGAIVVVGVLTSGYAILQFYGQGFLQLQPGTYNRMSSTLSNPIFAGALMLLTVSITTVAATINLQDPTRTKRFCMKAGIWSIILTFQFLGLIFTLSRGPWIGTIVSLLGFLSLVGIFIGWRTLGRAVLVIVVASVMTVAIITLTEGRTNSAAADPRNVEPGERFATIGTEVAVGGLSERLSIWRTSYSLMVSRAWFEHEDLRLKPLRPLIGYGPETFRVTFFLAHPPQGENLLPIDSPQAHNYLVHQGVELGFLGLLTSLGVFAVFGLAVAYLLMREGRNYTTVHKLLLVGLLATMVGRYVEQMVGLPKVSDMVIFWVLLGTFVALPAVMGSPNETNDKSPAQSGLGRRRRFQRHPRRDFGIHGGKSYLKWALVLLLVATVGWITWTKGVNNVLAAQEGRTASRAFRQGDFQNSLDSLNKAISLSPDFAVYYHHRASVYSAYQGKTKGAREPFCSLQGDYRLCLAEKTYSSHQQGEQRHNYSFRGRLLLADSAEELARITGDSSLSRESVQLYEEAISLVPSNWRLRNKLALVHDDLGQPEAALVLLNESLAITAETPHSAKALAIRGKLFRKLGQLERAMDDFSEAIRLDPLYGVAFRDRGNTLDDLGRPAHAIDDFNEAIRLNPEDALAYNNRGVSYYNLGQLEQAIDDFNEAIRLDPDYVQAYQNRKGVLSKFEQTSPQ